MTIIPNHFELFIDLDGTWVECEVAWRTTGEIGIRYTSMMKHGTPTRTQVVHPVVPDNQVSLRRKQSNRDETGIAVAQKATKNWVSI